ncbi:MAG: polysaccharide biosynthesis tyrosine autokinase [Rhodobacterales bacterium]
MPQNKVVSLNDQKPNTHASQEFPRLATTGPEDDEIDLMALIGTLWRGKWIILLLAFLAVLIGGYYAYGMAIPKYTTTASVALDPQQQNVTDITSVMSGLSGDQATINTEVEVIRSRNLMKKLVKKLSLTKDPEFNSRLKPANPYAIIPFIKDQLGLTEPEKIPGGAEILDATVDSLLKAISVSNLRQSYVFNITATTESPEKSALLANTLSDLYILDQLDVKFQATQQATKWLTARVAELKVKLEDAVNKVKDFNAQAELVSPEGLAALQRQVKETRDRIKNTEADLLSAQDHIKALEDAQQNGDPEQMAALANQGTLNRVLVLLKAGSIDRDVFDQAFATLLQRAKLDYSRAVSQTTALKTSATRLEAQIGRQSSDLVTLQQLQQEAAASQTIYDYFLKRLKETTVQQGIQKADSRVLSQAVVPTLASAPRKSLILALSGILGLFAGAGLVLSREMLQNGFRTAEDLERATGYTVMGQIPIMPVKRRVDALSYLIKKPTSAAAESVRNLRTSVLLSDVDNPPRVIMVTSSMPGEGKTTNSLALSQNLAGLGKRVLLVEGDIRRRTFTQYFNIENQRGILAVISGETSLEDAVYRDPKVGFDVLVGEKSSTNAADLFSSEKFHGFLNEMREIYDYVVIDTPPVLVVPDARVIAQSVDAVLYSVKWDATPKSQVIQGLKMFETVNHPVTGLILAQIDPKGLKRYGYGGKYGGYYGYYAKGYYDN